MQILMLTQALCAILLAVSFDTDAKPNGLRINGGQDAEEDEFPFIVFLDVRMYEKHKNLGIIEKKLMHCAGSIITKYHVLTAAHCVNSELEPSRISKKSPYRVRPEDVFVYVGVHNKDDVDDLERSRKFKVAKINRHEQFDRASGFNDIALLTLKKSIKFHTSIGGKRFCLPPKLTNFRKGYTVTTVGWGHVNILGGLPSVLQKIKAEIISHENKMIFTDTMKGGHCQYSVVSAFKGWFKSYEYKVNSADCNVTEKPCKNRGGRARWTILWGWLSSGFRLDIGFKGDSGGPVIGKGGALVGIVSHSKLEGKPYCTAGVGIRDASTCVADYIDWISEKIRHSTHLEMYNIKIRSTRQILMSTQALCAILLTITLDTGAIPNGQRINGGQDAEEDEFPFIVFLDVHMYKKDKNTRIITKKWINCAGSIITKNHVLTAAHCVKSDLDPFKIYKKSPHRVKPKDVFVYVGVHNKNDVDDPERYEKRDVADIYPHAAYERSSLINDIALLTLGGTGDSYELSREVNRIICLPKKPTRKMKSPVTIMGWGYANRYEDVLPLLQKSNVTIKSHVDKYFVTYTKKATTCGGDSGGPIIRKGTLVGIVSTGDGEDLKEYPCTAGKRTVDENIRVAGYLTWIKSGIRKSKHPNAKPCYGNE